MKELLLNTKKNIEELTENLVASLSFNNKEFTYPEIDKLIPNKDIVKLLIPLMNGDEEIDASELTAILLYTSQKNQIEKYSDIFLGVALTEMYHYDRLQELIKQLGGKFNQFYTNQEAQKIGTTPKEALQIAINAENQTIINIQEVINKISKITSYPQRTTIIQFLSKILEDEKVHLEIFQKYLVQESMQDLVESKSEIKINI
jgi:rubrerythrin